MGVEVTHALPLQHLDFTIALQALALGFIDKVYRYNRGYAFNRCCRYRNYWFEPG